MALKKSAKLLLAMAGILALAACGGEPSEGDIKSVITKEMDAQGKAMSQFSGKQAADMAKGFMPEIKNVKKIGCKPDGDKAYKCDVEMEVTQMGATNKAITPIRFVKGSDGWVATK